MHRSTALVKDDCAVGNILLVEDSTVIRHLMIEMLEEGGFDVHAVEHGFAALEYLGPGKGLIDVMVTDLTMPHMDGLALIRELRLRMPSARTVLMTGYADVMELAQKAGEQPDLVLTKPFRPRELLEAVRWVIGMERD